MTTTNTSHTWNCTECFDTECIDRGGREIRCPYCPLTIKITGLSHGLGDEGRRYSTVTAYSGSTITFVGTAAAILADVTRVERDAKCNAIRSGFSGSRNGITSGSIAIGKRVRAALQAA